MFPSFLTPELSLLLFPETPTTFLTCFCRGERRKYAGIKNSPQPGIEPTTTKSWVRHSHHWAIRTILRRSDNVLKRRWTHYIRYRRTSILFGTQSSWASTGSTFALHWLELLVLSLPLFVFCGICRRQCHYEFNTVFWKSCIVFCARPKEADPIKLISPRQISVSIALKYIINNSMKINRIRASMTETLSFFIDNFYNRFIVLLAQIYTNFVTWGSSSPNQFVPEIVSLLPCLSGLVRRILLFVYFFKERISFIGSLDKCHTRVFNTLIQLCWQE